MRSLLTVLFIAVILVFAAAAEEPVKPDQPQAEPERGLLSSILATDPLPERGRDRLRVSLGGLYDFKAGNTNNFSANGLFSFVYNDGKTEFSTTYKRFYTETNHKQVENNGEGLVRLDRFVFHRLEFFLFTEFVDDRRIKVKIRNNTGAGAKLVLFRNRYWLLDASCAPLYQVEIYTPYHFTSKDYSAIPSLTIQQSYDYYKKHRASYPLHQIRFSYRARISLTPFGDRFEIRSALFYVPVWNKYDVYRMFWDSYVRLRLFKDSCERWAVSVLCGYQRKYNTTVQPDARKFDDRVYGRIEWEQKFL